MANDKLMTYEQGSDMITKLNTIAANISQINKNIDLGANKVTSMAGYTLQSDASNITTSDTLNQAVSKLEKRVEDNKTNISNQQDTTASGGNGYAIINGQRLYMSDTAPSGTIPVGSSLVSNGKVWGYKASTVVNPTILSDGTAVSDYTIKGNTEQNGTPSPSNPVDVVGVGILGKNLYNMSAGAYQTGVRYNSSGEVESDENYSIWSIGVSALSSGTYIFSLDTTSASTTTLRVVGFKNGAKVEIIGATQMSNMPLSITVTDAYDEIRFSAANSYAERIMLNSGSTALPYEPYGYYLPVSSGNVITNIPIGTVQTTRVIKKLVLTGQETGWNRSSSDGRNIFYLDTITPDYLRSDEITLLCSHYKAIAGVTAAGYVGEGETSVLKSVGVNQGLYFGDSNYSEVDDFKTYLAQQYANGTPVCVWYVLANETTGILNEPLMGIGDYVDSITGTQSQISIPTTAGENAITFGTTVQPSRFDITAWVEDVLTPEQEAVLNSGITSTDVTQIETNKNNILTVQGKVKAHSEGGTDYDVINSIRVYVSATQPTGDIPVGSLWIGG